MDGKQKILSRNLLIRFWLTPYSEFDIWYWLHIFSVDLDLRFIIFRNFFKSQEYMLCCKFLEIVFKYIFNYIIFKCIILILLNQLLSLFLAYFRKSHQLLGNYSQLYYRTKGKCKENLSSFLDIVHVLESSSKLKIRKIIR